jgi:hypothetical protein
MAIPMERLGDIQLHGAAATSPQPVAAGRSGGSRLGHLVSNAFSFGVALGIIIALATRPTLSSVLLLGVVVLIQPLSTFSLDAPSAAPGDATTPSR